MQHLLVSVFATTLLVVLVVGIPFFMIAWRRKRTVPRPTVSV
jgi:hypothetical protein